jgi:anthranilate phosphoribosyltransferase
MISAIVLINVQKGQLPQVVKQLGEIDEVIEIYSVAGRYDIVVKVQVEEYERMSEVVTEKLQAVEGIASTETLMAFKVYKF